MCLNTALADLVMSPRRGIDVIEMVSADSLVSQEIIRQGSKAIGQVIVRAILESPCIVLTKPEMVSTNVFLAATHVDDTRMIG